MRQDRAELALDLAVGLGHGCPVGLRLDDEVARAEPAERERVGRVRQPQRELGSGPTPALLVDLEVEQGDHAGADEEHDEQREQREAEAVVLPLELGSQHQRINGSTAAATNSSAR